MKNWPAYLLFFLLTLAACSPVNPAGLATGTAVPAVTDTKIPPATATGVRVTAGISTAVPGFVASLPPEETTLLPPTAVPATPIPTLPSGGTPTKLKYQILAAFPDQFFCDPDLYPIARDNVLELAKERFPAIQANQEEFAAILAQLGLANVTGFTEDQILQIYQEHKKLAAVFFELSGEVYTFQLQIEDTDGQSFLIRGRIDGNGGITIDSQEPNIAGCPICLAAHSLIDTAFGMVPVEEIQAGNLVWTADSSGKRVLARVVLTRKTPVLPTHEILHLTLSDGRELRASPGHPLPGGLILQDLKVGATLDGARVTRLQLEPYNQAFTYDLLPSGDTGFYWADGVLVGSTLAEK